MDTSCVKQSGKSKYVARVLKRAVLKKYEQQPDYGKPKYVAHVVGEVVSKRYISLPRTKTTDTF